MNSYYPDKLVVDSSVAIKWFVAEVYSTEALNILSGFRAGRYRLLAPDFMLIEVSNIV